MADVKDLDVLKSQLEAGRPTDGRLTLTPSVVPDGAFLAFLQTLPQQQLIVENPHFLPTGTPATRLDISGTVYGSWTIPHIAGGKVSGIQITISFLKNRQADPILSTLAVTQGTLTLSGKPVPVVGQMIPGSVLLSFMLQQPTELAPTFSLSEAVNFLGGSRYGSMVPLGVPIFDTVHLSGGQLTFGFDPAAPTAFSVTADVNGDWEIIEGGMFTLKKVGLTLIAIYEITLPGDPAVVSFAGNVHATTQIANADFDIFLRLANKAVWELGVLPRSGQLIPGLLDLASHVGGDSLKSTVQTGVKTLGLGDISIDGIQVGFDLAHRKFLYLDLRSHITVGGGKVFLYTRLPDFQFYGGLPPRPKGDNPVPSGISVKALASQALGEEADMPELTITQLSLYAYPSQGTYRMDIRTEEDWSWDLSGTGKGPSLTLEQLGVNFEKSPQTASGGLFVAANLGGFEVTFSAQYQGRGLGWLFIGTGSQEHTVPLGTFVQDVAQKIGASVPSALLQAVQGVEINNLNVVFDTKQKSFQFTADTTVTGTLPFGSKSYDLETRAFLSSTVDPATGLRSFVGHFEADLEVGNALFVVSYDFGPTAKTIIGRWRSEDDSTIGFNDLAELLGIEHTVSVPKELDLGLKAASFEYHVADSNFTLSAESTKFGDAFFSAGKGQTGSLGFVFGVDFPPKAKLSSLPVIGNDLKAADFLTFKQAAVLLASTTLRNYTIPILPPLPSTPPVAGTPWTGRVVSGRTVKPIASGATLQLSPGLSVAGALDFAGSSDDHKTSNLLSIVGADELLLQVTIGQTGLSLFAELAGNVGIPTGGNSRLALTNPAIRIDLTTETVFQLSGGMKVSINGANIVATARLIIDESEAQVAIDISGDHSSLPPPPGVKGLHFQDFGLVMGVFFEPPGLDLGVQGKFRIGETEGTKDDEFAIVLEVVEEVPNILYLSFYVDKLDLGQVVTLFTDRTEPAIVQAMEIVKASDLSFHWAENVVVLPDGSIGQPGFGFSASIDIFTFGAHADLQVGVTDGIHGKAEMAPVDVKGILKIDGDGKGISRTYQQVDGQWQLAGNDSIVRQKPMPPTRTEVVVAPGGPLIEFNCLHSPFVHVNWQVTLFDIQKIRTDVTISSSGFTFLLSYDVAGIERFDVHCTLKDRDHFKGDATFHLGIDQRIGPIHVLGVDCGTLHLTARIDASMSVELDPSRFAMGIDGSFNFEGLGFSMPTLKLSVAPSSLKELPGKIAQQIRDHADEIFATLFADAKKWAEMIGRGVVVGVTDMANALKNAYHKTAQEAAQLMKQANQAVDSVASGLKTAYGLSADAAASAMRGAGYAAEQVAAGLKQGYNLTTQGVVTALKSAGYAVDQIGNALKSAYGQTAQQAAQLLQRAGYTADQVGNALKIAYGASALQAAQILKGAGFAVDQVGNALKTAYGSTAQQAAQILRGAGYAADQVGNAMRIAFGATANQAAQLLKGAGYTVDQVGNALRSVWGASANIVAAALKGAGYAVDQVGNFVKNAFNLGPDALNSVLQGVGFAEDQIKGFFNSLGGAFADVFKDIGHALDPTHW
jgi:hypothetical protein